MELSHKTTRGLWMCVMGCLIGGILATWLAPKMIAWYFTPPAQMGFTCVEPIQWALGKLQIAQAVGVLVGGLVGLGAYYGRSRSTGQPEPAR